MSIRRNLTRLTFLVLSLSGISQASLVFARNSDFEIQRAHEYLRVNISPQGGALGSLAASPSKESPNYFFHWVRDAAIVLKVEVNALEAAHDPKTKMILEKLLMDSARFERSLQKSDSESGLGEPKFNMNGSTYKDPWGRPQNDSPALRAITFIQLANYFLRVGNKVDLRFLYNSKGSLIKDDLEYVARYFKDPSFDLWEEVKGLHFFTLAVSRKALVVGADLAIRLGDQGAANYYRTQQLEVEKVMERFFQKGRVLPTLDQKNGLDSKKSDLDMAVILAFIHGETEDSYLANRAASFKITMAALEESFFKIYPINRFGNGVAGGIGRYPEDIYNGNGFSLGNPWFVTTNAAAEFYCLLGEKEKGREFIQRSFNHRDQKSGRMAEQFNRDSGYMQGARDLSWSYASLISALEACL